jgi:microcystin-dependent protein
MDGNLAEIRMFAGNFAPLGWQFCQGQLLSIAQYTAVFALVGTTYGGNGQTTFGLPDFRGRISLGAQYSQGPGLPAIQLGEMAGVNSITLLTTNIPAHAHQVTGNVLIQANNNTNTITDDPTGRRLASTGNYTSNSNLLANMAATSINLPTTAEGSGTPVSTRSPYIGMNYIICIEGIFPSRN